MAKGNMLLGKARGSVGDLTFSVSNGEQISRAKAKSVKNPRTDAQMIQRVIMATTVQAYSGMQAIVDHSFQGVAYQGPSMNKFNSLNSKALRSAYAAAIGKDTDLPKFNRNGMKSIAANEYIMSTGSLPTIELPTRVSESGFGDEIITDYTQFGEAPNVSYGSTGVALVLANDVTYAQLIARFGLQAGDQLTLCALTRKSGETERGCQFRYGRFILMPADGDLSHLVTDATVANEKNQNCKFVQKSVTVGEEEVTATMLAFADLDEAGEQNTTVIYAAGIIVSRLENSSWKRNNCVLQLAMRGDDVVDGGYTMQEAIDSYNGVSFDTNSPWYLNKASKGTTKEPAGVLKVGEVGFRKGATGSTLVYNNNGIVIPVLFQVGEMYSTMVIVSDDAFGMTVKEASEARLLTIGNTQSSAENGVLYSTVVDKVIQYATE